MLSLTSTIRDCTLALAAVTPETLTPEQITSSMEKLKMVDVDQLIRQFHAGLPAKPEEDKEVETWEEERQQQASALNRDLKQFNDELSRLKELHQTLNLMALEPLITEAQKVIRPLYGLTAGLNSSDSF
jgi:hypothetical protein